MCFKNVYSKERNKSTDFIFWLRKKAHIYKKNIKQDKNQIILEPGYLGQLNLASSRVYSKRIKEFQRYSRACIRLQNNNRCGNKGLGISINDHQPHGCKVAITRQQLGATLTLKSALKLHSTRVLFCLHFFAQKKSLWYTLSLDT